LGERKNVTGKKTNEVGTENKRKLWWVGSKTDVKKNRGGNAGKRSFVDAQRKRGGRENPGEYLI